MNLNRNHRPRSFRYFIAELLILVLGISASFLLNEWRINRQEGKQERDLLESFKANLITDSLAISGGIKTYEVQIENGRKILENETQQYSDSLNFQILSFLSYPPFRSNDITYEEMKSASLSHLLQNDSLRSQIIGVYENGYELLDTWLTIDGDHVRNKLITHIEKNFPYAPNFQYDLTDRALNRRLVNTVLADEFKHLIQFGTSYKTNSKAIFELVLAEIRETIELIDKELSSTE